jgi:hypothetical protein
MDAMAEIDRDRRGRVQALLDMDGDADIGVDHVAEALLDPVGEEAAELLRPRQRLGGQHHQRGEGHVDRLRAAAAIGQRDAAIAVDQVLQRGLAVLGRLAARGQAEDRLAPEVLDAGHRLARLAGDGAQAGQPPRVVHHQVHEIGQGHGVSSLGQERHDGNRFATRRAKAALVDARAVFACGP